MSDRAGQARQDVFEHAQTIWRLGLVTGSAGNVSARIDGTRIAVTPSSLPYERMTGEDIVVVDRSGSRLDGRHEPSYELPMHLAIYDARSDVQAIVHTHSPFVTTLSILRRPLPPIIDEMVVHLGGAVGVAEYAFTGTGELAANVVSGLGRAVSVMLANHGNVCVGATLALAAHRAIVMEACARLYVQALAIGTPVELPPRSVESAMLLFQQRYPAGEEGT